MVDLDVRDAVIAILEERARSRRTISYGELSSLVEGLPQRGKKMTDTLSEVSNWSWNEREVLLPVLVVNARGAQLPSDGFYETLAVHRPDDDQSDLSVAARRERERVYRMYPS